MLLRAYDRMAWLGFFFFFFFLFFQHIDSICLEGLIVDTGRTG